MDDKPQKTDRYRDTVFLPKTSFGMKAGLPQKEPELIKRWEAMDLYGTLRKASAGKPKYVLHDGPPYANGHLHIGHALNKILKDIVTRSRQMQGFDSNYVPGWDCHGLPIEFKVVKEAAGLEPAEIRRRCTEFAGRFIDIQRASFRRL
ncbi:MAG: class I tRNA ligase family protein, partial [Alphaproteobacteria bacterium]|nr:class I tRNA ligase family protein [Alphaproteobacteria bacterium]